MAEETAEREDLIETKYIGDFEPFIGTSGEAYFDYNKGTWSYRPTGGIWNHVETDEIDCVDEGWVRGNYLGKKFVPKAGKAFWSEDKDAWIYKPKGKQTTLVVPEGEFEMLRDEEYA